MDTCEYPTCLKKKRFTDSLIFSVAQLNILVLEGKKGS